MGIVVNGASDIGATIANARSGVAHGAKCPLNMVNKPSGNHLAANSAHSLDFGSLNCPLLKESRQGV